MKFSSIRFWSIARIVLAFVAALPDVLFAQLPIARITNLFPPGGRIGSVVEVAVAGSDLDEPVRLHFSHDGITAKPKAEANKFIVTIASNVPPGIYEGRFVGRFGISNPRAFVVGDLPEVIAPGTNITAASALELKPDTTVHSRSSPNSVSWFKITAKKSQRLFIECLAENIDSRMAGALVLTDAGGRELERDRRGGLLDFTAPSDGTYLLKVSDFLYRGGDDYFYRLTLSTGPHLDFVMPPAALAGTKTNFTLYGRNLPGGKPVKGLTLDGKPLEQLAVEIAMPAGERARRRLDTGLLVRPADAALDGFEYRLKTAKGLSNPLLITFATAPVVLEREPNDKPSQSQKLTPPCEVAGQFFPANDQDWFTFDAKKGDVFWIEVFSQRLGLPTDPFLILQRVSKNDKGEEQSTDVLELYDNDTNIGDREFNTASRDPVARFEAKEEGTYRLQVRDLFGHTTASPRHVYRLAIRRAEPDFRLVAMSVVAKAKADAKNVEIGVPLLRRGETIPVRVMVFRQDGFNGDIDLSLENPPPGLIFTGDRIEAGKNSDVILLTAAADAPAWFGALKLVGKAKIGDRELVREVRGASQIHPVASTDSQRPVSRLTRDFTVGISDKESAPISVAAAENKIWEADAGTKLTIPLKITRRGEFNATLKLKPLGPGPQEALKEFDVESKATNAALALDVAALKLAPGSYVFALQGTTTGKYRNNPEAATVAEAVAKEADKLAADSAAAAKKAAGELEQAAKAAKEADETAKAAAEKLAAAKAAAEKDPTDEKLAAVRDEAEKAAGDAAGKSKSAAETKAAADKARSTAEGKVKETQARKESAQTRAREAADKAKPRDVTITVYSQPIAIKVVPAQVAAKAEGEKK